MLIFCIQQKKPVVGIVEIVIDLLGDRSTIVSQTMTASNPIPLSGSPLFLPVVAAIFLLSSALFLWRLLGGSQTKKVVENVAPKKLTLHAPEAEPEDLTKKKVSVFFGTQTGTAEGFAKV